ncbi:MAG: hypothetical protein KGL44_00640 [Sphingomonadales bacterium]|nr:hypothetical protein [Sphingomonadales bacterium]
MKTVIKFAALASVAAMGLALSACDSAKENKAEDQAQQVREASESAADAMENSADAVRATSEAKADAMEDKADTVRATGDAKADAMENKADKMDKAPQ